MDIGIVGVGMIGGTLAKLWARAGHCVHLGSRTPSKAAALAKEIAAASSGSPEDAAGAAEVVLLAGPYSATPELGEALGGLLQGNVLLDAGNPFEKRDGEVARAAAKAGGSGLYTAECFPGARVVKAFNTVHWETLEQEAHRDGERIGVPLAGDDENALEVASSLAFDAGFDPVIVGGLAEAIRFEPGTEAWNSDLGGAALRAKLGL